MPNPEDIITIHVPRGDWMQIESDLENHYGDSLENVEVGQKLVESGVTTSDLTRLSALAYEYAGENAHLIGDDQAADLRGAAERLEQGLGL